MTLNNVILKYTGGGFGGSITGWPARDLTKADVDKLEKEGVSLEALIQSELYELAPMQAKPHQRVIVAEKDEA